MAFEPSDLSSLLAWWDATVGVTDTAGNVTAWATRYAIDNPGQTVRNPKDLSDIIQQGKSQQ